MSQIQATTKILGNAGEKKVAEYLQKHGFTICAYNFFCRYGEIDLIASKKELMVSWRLHRLTPVVCALLQIAHE